MPLLLMMIGCTPDTYVTTNVYQAPEVPEDSWAMGTPEADCTAPISMEEMDIFAADGYTFYLQLPPEQVKLMDVRACGGDDWYDYATYNLESENDPCPTYVQQAWILSPDNMLCAETGQIELATFGESSFQEWINKDDGSLGIPNIRFDFGEFTDQNLADGTSHLRLSNGQAESGVTRLDIAAHIWREMGYPAPRTRFVRVQTDLWDDLSGPGTWAAYTAFEPYKKNWVKAYKDEHKFTSIWEGFGDILWDDGTIECWWSDGNDCEEDLLDSIVEQLMDHHEDLMQDTQGLVDWPHLHQNLCLTNITGTWDNWSHNTNNLVVALGQKGLIFLPYSMDISGGHKWYSEMPDRYWGWSGISNMCAQDLSCRTEALETCLTMINEFDSRGLTSIVTERCDALETAGLVRSPDAEICDEVVEFYTKQPGLLRGRLEEMLAGGYDTAGWDTGEDSGWWVDTQ